MKKKRHRTLCSSDSPPPKKNLCFDNPGVGDTCQSGTVATAPHTPIPLLALTPSIFQLNLPVYTTLAPLDKEVTLSLQPTQNTHGVIA